MLSGMQRMPGSCSRTAAAKSEKLEGRPNPRRSACQTAGVPSAIKMFSINPPVTSPYSIRANPRRSSCPLEGPPHSPRSVRQSSKNTRVVDVTPTFDGFDVAVHRREVGAHRDDRYVTPPSFAPRCNIARPLVVPATILLDGLEAECIAISSELDKLGFDPRLDLDRLGLSSARKQETVSDSGRPVERGLAGATQLNRDLPCW